MADTKNDPSTQAEGQYFTYVTHHIPWYVRGLWIGFWIGMIWYLIVNAIPMAKNYF